MTIPAYMQGPYNKCHQLGWLTPEFVSNTEFIIIFKKACDCHQGKGDHPRYAKKVMTKFKEESLDGSTITPLHNGLNALVKPRMQAKADAMKAAAAKATLVATQAALRREAEVQRLKAELTKVQNTLTTTTQALNKYQTALNTHQQIVAKLNAEIVAERAAKRTLEEKVKQVSLQLQASKADVSELGRQLGAACVANQASTARLEQKIGELNQMTAMVVSLSVELGKQSASLAVLQQNQINTNRLLAQLLQAALG